MKSRFCRVNRRANRLGYVGLDRQKMILVKKFFQD